MSRKPLTKKYSKICSECKIEFRAISNKAETCGAVKCKNERQRKKAKIAYDNLSIEEKKIYRNKKNKVERKKYCISSHEKIPTKCPVCKIIYKHIFEYGWTGLGIPYKICPKCVKKINKNKLNYELDDNKSFILLNEVDFQ